MDDPFGIVGLGNPGRRYQGTRHNTGFEVIDQLARRWQVGLTGGKGEYLIAPVHREQQRVLLVKPTTYMNLSGHAVRDLVAYYRIPLDRLLVVMDDVNLPLGKLRLRPCGGTGGHHGLDNILLQLGSDTFPRLRIGVGGEHLPDDLTGYVLGRFGEPELPLITEAIARGVEAVEFVLREGIQEAMNRIN